MKKKIVSILTSVVLALAITACGAASATPTTDNTESTKEETTASETTTEEAEVECGNIC